jgi:hypothetical protein
MGEQRPAQAPSELALLPESKLKLLFKLPSFVRQRRRILENPHLIHDPPRDALGWLNPSQFVAANVTYLLLLVGLPKVVFWLLGWREPTATAYLGTAEWAWPLFVYLSARVMAVWLTWFYSYSDEQIEKFRVLYILIALTKPFWLYVGLGAVAWLFVCLAALGLFPMASGPLPIHEGFLVLLAMGAAVWAFLAFMIVFEIPHEAVETAARFAHVSSNWIMGISQLINFSLILVTAVILVRTL